MKFKLNISHTQFVGLLVVMYIVALSVLSRNTRHYPYGDGPEYILMTESFTNHFSPELRKSDVEKYIDYLDKYNLELHKRDVFELIRDNPIYENTTNKDGNRYNFSGYFLADNGKWYCYHFWLYSLVNVPARIVLDHLQADIRITFLATNLFFIFLGIWIISKLDELKVGQRVVLSLLLVFSPALWYIDWAHAEVFAGIFTFLAMILFHVKRKYLSLFFFSISATHYPPLFIPALIVFIDILYRSGFKLKVLIKLFFASFWVVLPTVFYLIHFGEANLIADSGFLSMEVVDLRRLHSFFFDLNQGMILAIPLILILMIGFLIADIVKRRFFTSYYFLLSILLMSIFFMQMTNWNHGQAVVNRYVVWSAAIIMVVFYIRILKIKKIWFYVISVLIITTQIIAIFSQQEFNKYYWHANNFNKLSKFVMKNYPSFYNPDPMIFKGRLNPHELSTDSVRVFTNEDGQIVKMLIKEGSISNLVQRGIEEDKVKELEEGLNYYHGYAYVNKDDLMEIGYDQSKDEYHQMLKQQKSKHMKEYYKNQILSSPGWYEEVKRQANEWGLTVDSTLQLNAEYLYQRGLENSKK